MRKPLVMLALLFMIMAVVPAAAQIVPSEDTPVVRMLSHIPNTIEARTELSYVDYQAILAARPDVPKFNTFAEFEAAFRGENGNLVMATLNGIQSGPSFLQYLLQSEDLPELLGFDFFDIAQAVSFGTPPAEVFIVQGDFDPAAVIAAHQARDFTQDELNDITLLCGAAGCENGMVQNLMERNPANIFGGNLGRSQPTLVTDTWIATSPSIDMITEVAETDVERSLAEQPDYRSAVEAVEANGTLLQSWFVLPSDVLPVSDMLAMGQLTEEQSEALEERLKEDFVPIPAWNLALLADVATETDQQAIVALVYTDHEDAEAAAAQFPARLLNATSMMTMQSFGEILADRGMTSAEVNIYPSTRERYAVLVTLHSPLPSNVRAEDGYTEASSLVYGILPRAFLTRDVAWLAPEF
jgi:hypothetical protein